MAADTHSRLVGWLKVVLPLMALALLSTLFLVADRIDPNDAIPYAEVDVEDLLKDPRMSAPTYAGTTSDGAAITVSAASARPAGQDSGARAEAVTALLDMPDGGHAEMTAAEAKIDDAAGLLALSGGVRIATSSGYTLETEGMTARLDRSELAGPGPVSAIGPPGQITAQGFALTRKPAADGAGDYLLVFSGGVKLIYQPGGG